MKRYVTTSIPYANAKPHIGHSLDCLIADVWARYHQQQGDEVRFSAGLDEHGTKIAQKAAEAGVPPQQFVDDLTPSFREMIRLLNAEPTDFIRTTDADHKRRVQEIWKKLDAAGMIYKGTYEGWYCVGCEGFITETEARDANYQCPIHQKPLEKLSEENYYLRVSQFSDQIREFAAGSIVPAFRGREILELVRDGAQDVSISRPAEKLSWGVPVPGDETQVMYVWVDALSNYITVLGYPEDEIGDWWPADLQVVGKDNNRFHAIIWPAMLLGLGLGLPGRLLVHGFINVDGTKMSKSLGNVIAVDEIVDKYGSDAFRYYFLRHIPTFDDGDFTWDKFAAAYNGELANDLGNLVSRVANMVGRYGVSPANGFDWDKSGFEKFMSEFRYDLALESVWGLVQHLNRRIDETKPWEMAKSADSSQQEAVSEVMGYLVAGLVELSGLLVPFLPDTAAKIAEIFGGETVGDAPILFPRLDK